MSFHGSSPCSRSGWFVDPESCARTRSSGRGPTLLLHHLTRHRELQGSAATGAVVSVRQRERGDRSVMPSVLARFATSRVSRRDQRQGAQIAWSVGTAARYLFHVPDELRVEFHRELEKIDRQVLGLFALVGECVAGATDALLTGDRDAAKVLVERHALIDRAYLDIEEVVQRLLVLQSPVASELRFLLTAFRIVPELERSADLSEHIAH